MGDWLGVPGAVSFCKQQRVLFSRPVSCSVHMHGAFNATRGGCQFVRWPYRNCGEMKLSVWLSYIAGMSGKVFNSMMSLKFAIIQSDREAVVSDRRRFPYLPNLVFELIIP